MKKHLYELLAVLMAAAMLLLAAGCGGNNAQSTPASQSAQQPGQEDEGGAGPDTDAPEEAGNADDAEAPEAGAQSMSIEEYKEMAARFAFYCDSVYFDYQGSRGTVTILDVQVEEDTEAQCRIRVYYQEPALTDDPNSWTDPTDGYMTFAVDKATAQGKMECWEFLGVPGEYLPETVDQMDVAIGYSRQLVEAEMSDAPAYEMEDIYDFASGNILYASGALKADANAYWAANSLQ